MGRAPSPSQDCAHHGHNYTAVFGRKSEKPPTLLLRELRLFVWQRELSQELIWGHTHARNPKEPPARLPAWPLASDPGRGGSHIHTHTHMCTHSRPHSQCFQQVRAHHTGNSRLSAHSQVGPVSAPRALYPGTWGSGPRYLRGFGNHEDRVPSWLCPFPALPHDGYLFHAQGAHL